MKESTSFSSGCSSFALTCHAQNTRGVNGNLNFTGQFSNATATTGILGEGYADFITAQMNGMTRGRPFYDDDQSNYYGFYVQDAWRATSHLTVNLGLRFEPFPAAA